MSSSIPATLSHNAKLDSVNRNGTRRNVQRFVGLLGFVCSLLVVQISSMMPLLTGGGLTWNDGSVCWREALVGVVLGLVGVVVFFRLLVTNFFLQPKQDRSRINLIPGFVTLQFAAGLMVFGGMLWIHAEDERSNASGNAIYLQQEMKFAAEELSEQSSYSQFGFDFDSRPPRDFMAEIQENEVRLKTAKDGLFWANTSFLIGLFVATAHVARRFNRIRRRNKSESRASHEPATA